ncbi:MAG: hypothetical protein KBG30_09110 [Bacteroidales bacterium]|jgi:hypothetical protein|nr:hypothetical protein [Bacteroidales bacterium]
MEKQEVKLKAENLLKEISFKAPLHYQECVEVALLIVDKILEENPTKIYWKTCDDETPSAVTVWGEVKAELEALK